MIMQEQDKTIDSITSTVAVLTEQAGLMGQEIEEHIECVPTFDSFHPVPFTPTIILCSTAPSLHIDSIRTMCR